MVTVVARLFVRSGSSKAVAKALLTMVPVAIGVTRIVTIALVPRARLPSSQTTPERPCAQGRVVATADTNLTSAGSSSVRTTLGLSAGPLFVTMTV